MTEGPSGLEQQDHSREAAVTPPPGRYGAGRGLFGLGWRFGQAAAERAEWQARVGELEQERDELRLRLVTLEQAQGATLQDVEQLSEEQQRHARERDQWRRWATEVEQREAERERQIAEFEQEREEWRRWAAAAEQREAEAQRQIAEHEREREEWRSVAAENEHRQTGTDQQLAELERERDELQARLARLEQEHAANLQEVERHAILQQRSAEEREEWRRRAEAAELERRTAAAAQGEVQARIAHFESRAGAVDAIVEAVEASIAELRDEGERMLRRPGMWRTEMIATFCNYMATRLERNLAAALPTEMHASPGLRPAGYPRERGRGERAE